MIPLDERTPTPPLLSLAENSQLESSEKDADSDKEIDSYFDEAKKIFGGGPDVEKKKKEADLIRIKILPLIFAPLNLPQQAQHVMIKDLVFFLLLDLLSKTEGSLDEDGKQAFISFIDFLNSRPASESNLKRLETFFAYLKKHVKDSLTEEQGLKALENAIKEVKSALNYFLKFDSYFQSCSITQVLSSSTSSDPMMQCQYLCPKLETLSSFIFELVRNNLKTLHQALAEKKTGHRNNLKLQTSINQLFSKENVLSEKLDKALNLLRSRYALYSEQLQQIKDLISNPLTSNLEAAKCILKQLNSTTRTLKNLITSCRKEVTSSSEILSMALPDERLQRVEKMLEELKPFQNDFTEEEQKNLTSIPGLTALGVIQTQVKTERLQEKMSDLSIPADIREDFYEVMQQQNEVFKTFADKMIQMASAFSKVTESVEKGLKNKAEFKKDVDTKITKALAKNRVPLSQHDKVYESLEGIYILFSRLEDLFNSFEQGMDLITHVSNLISDQVKLISPKEPEDDSPLLELLFDNTHRKIIRHKKRPEPFESTPPVEPVPEIQQQPSEIVITVTYEQAKAKLLTLLLDTSKASDTMIQEAKPFIKDFEIHAQFYGKSLDLLRTCISNHVDGFSLILSYFFTRYGSLMIEHALTAKLLLTREEVVIQHSLQGLGQQLDLEHPVLEALDVGSVYHRYPHLSKPCKFFESNLAHQVTKPLEFVHSCVFDAPHNTINVKTVLESLHQADSKFKNFPLQQLFQSGIKPLIESSLEAQKVLEKLKLPKNSLEQRNLMNVSEHIVNINTLLKLMQKLPKASYLDLYGDALLTLVQYLDEQIERALYFRELGEMPTNHNLRNYREWRGADCSEEEWYAVDALNIEKFAQYPHQAFKNYASVGWRLNTARLCTTGEKFDEAIHEGLLARKSGFTMASKNNSLEQMESTLRELTRMVLPILESAVTRLQSLQ